MKRLMNKRADVTITTVILIVLGLVVLVMLIVGFTKGTDFFFNIFKKAPTDLSSLVEACSLQVSANLAVDFCKYELLDILGDEEVVNCEHPLVRSGLDNKGVVVPPSITDYCVKNRPAFLAKVCDKIGDGKKEQTKINGGPNNCATGVPTRLILSESTLSIKAKEEGKFSVSLSSKPVNNVDVSIISSDSILTAEPTTLTFTPDNWSVPQEVKLMTGEFNSAKQDVSVTLDGQGSSGKVKVTITK